MLNSRILVWAKHISIVSESLAPGGCYKSRFLFFFLSLQPPRARNIIFPIASVYNIHDLYRQFSVNTAHFGPMKYSLVQIRVWMIFLVPREMRENSRFVHTHGVARNYFEDKKFEIHYRVKASRTARSIVRYHVFHSRSRLNASQNKSQVSTDCFLSVT